VNNLSKFSVIVDTQIGKGTIIRDHVNLYKCKIGCNCKIESFVYIEEGVEIGNNCKIKPGVFIPTGVILEDDVFIGPNVTFTNDKYPRTAQNWKLLCTIVRKGASIGAHAVILPGIKIGCEAMIGAGAVVTKNVPDNALVLGNPATMVENPNKRNLYFEK
jgi:UDP-2-acetamido-3-amino-2,3-dideoxy-glucuronate N-acetyltransferase